MGMYCTVPDLRDVPAMAKLREGVHHLDIDRHIWEETLFSHLTYYLRMCMWCVDMWVCMCGGVMCAYVGGVVCAYVGCVDVCMCGVWTCG